MRLENYRVHLAFAAVLLLAVVAACRHSPPGSAVGATQAAPAIERAYLVGDARAMDSTQTLEGSVVQLLRPNAASGDSVVTNGRGWFFLGPVAPGSYRLRVKRIGFQSLDSAVVLHAGAIDTLRLRLKEAESLLWQHRDCIGPDGFGSQYCRDERVRPPAPPP